MRAVTVYVTGRCNLRCTHCAVGHDQDEPRGELDTEEMKAVLSRLAAGGTRYVTLLGGEATIYRRDLEALLEHAYGVGLGVSINTNAISYRALEPLLESPALETLVVSLDGASPETHDAMRGARAFQRTTETLRRVAGHPRMSSGELALEISYVISKTNWREAGRMIVFASELGARRLNAKHVKMTGRAVEFVTDLELNSKELLEAHSMLIITWLLAGKPIELEVHVPPSLAYYINARFGLDYPIDDHPACGGIDEFGYVDLTGNYLPCPAMSLEEDEKRGIPDLRQELNLLENPTDVIHQTDVFAEFEARRAAQAYRDRLYPCRICRFNDLTRPCTADLIKGDDEMEVDICRAVLEAGDEHVPGLREFVFPGANPAVPAGLVADQAGVTAPVAR